MTTYSTMGAPLTEAETARIEDAWAKLFSKAMAIPAAPQAPDMLEWITDTIMLCYEVRMAISDGWYYANKRAFPPQPRPAKAEYSKMMEMVEAVQQLSRDDIEELLKEVKKESHK